ncbi:hypothetical protein PAXRUDRAFT_150628 [Paxillus rubicundulus Ve08.2h10]|uniref:Uncharacterized protein n=1 Tax=Paxillus rubicundulus Ve08.2h10 TaxID=930991 RepID=A0A0D0DIX8_9AGAM|nr:hypothetical protein PAXRUDRAFT_150628 [Paxillus rubicundulus Ve08.2h10]
MTFGIQYPFLVPHTNLVLYRTFSQPSTLSFSVSPSRPAVASPNFTPHCPVINTFILQSSSPLPDDLSTCVLPPSWSPIFTSVSTRPRAPSYEFLSSTATVLSPIIWKAITSIYTQGPTARIMAYKPVAKKIHSILAPIEEQFCIVRRLPDDPLAGLTPLPTSPSRLASTTRPSRS